VMDNLITLLLVVTGVSLFLGVGGWILENTHD